MRIKKKKRTDFSENWNPEKPEAETNVEPLEPKSIVFDGKKSKKEEKEEEILKQESLRDLCTEFVDAEFSLPAIFTGDTRWREYLAQDRLEKLALRHYMFCKAWGIEMAGKISATIALALGLTVAFGEVSRKINAEDANLPPEAGADRKPS